MPDTLLEGISVKEVNERATGKTITAKLSYVNIFARTLHTTLPLRYFEGQFPHTILAVLAASLSKLEPVHLEHLQGGFARMYELCGEIDYTTLAGLAEISGRAFGEARAKIHKDH